MGAIDKKMGQSGSLTCDVIFEDCAVPAENIIGEEGEGFITAMKVLDRGRLHISGVSVGVAERLIADALDYAIRSEEHTSELQSRRNLVCRLLLAKKISIS